MSRWLAAASPLGPSYLRRGRRGSYAITWRGPFPFQHFEVVLGCLSSQSPRPSPDPSRRRVNGARRAGRCRRARVAAPLERPLPSARKCGSEVGWSRGVGLARVAVRFLASSTIFLASEMVWSARIHEGECGWFGVGWASFGGRTVTGRFGKRFLHADLQKEWKERFGRSRLVSW